LLGLINEILDLSAIESGEMVMTLQDVSLHEVLAECEAMVKPQAQEKKIDLHFPRFGQPDQVHADPVRTKQVLLNLLTNSIKYNRSPGRIEVACTAIPDGVRISVDDTGHGLSAAQIAQLFQSFNRLGKAASAEQGTGVGLVISKRLIELMHGRIGVESEVGVGSRFWFELGTQPPLVGADAAAL
jgi:signal transduction histidine kinase